MKRQFAVLLVLCASTLTAQTARWSEQKATDWYQRKPWLVGSNYIPATAINELEMWEAATFDPKRIDLELGWAEGIGMNTMRVFLDNLVWEENAPAYRKRIDTFLQICAKHKIRPLFVLFDSCWDPLPHLGPQHAPTPGVHNSGWVQVPGAKELDDPKDYPKLEAYVTSIVGAFAKDPRVLGWDMWNEPDNVTRVLSLLPKAFAWARAAGATQPLTSGVWKGDWSAWSKLDAMSKIQIENSDIVSFHNYDAPEELEKRILWLQKYKRPILCTEYMARGNHSTFEGSLPVLKKYKVAAINWGLVAGKTQTYLPWDSWEHPYTDREPAIWFHEVFKTDGMPYKSEEVKFIKQETGR